jgi:hypothetical protein
MQCKLTPDVNAHGGQPSNERYNVRLAREQPIAVLSHVKRRNNEAQVRVETRHKAEHLIQHVYVISNRIRALEFDVKYEYSSLFDHTLLQSPFTYSKVHRSFIEKNGTRRTIAQSVVPHRCTRCATVTFIHLRSNIIELHHNRNSARLHFN